VIYSVVTIYFDQTKLFTSCIVHAIFIQKWPTLTCGTGTHESWTPIRSAQTLFGHRQGRI